MLARAQQPALQVIGILGSSTAKSSPSAVSAFMQGLKDTGLVEGPNIGWLTTIAAGIVAYIFGKIIIAVMIGLYQGRGIR